MKGMTSIEENFLMSAFQSFILTDSHTYEEKVMNRNFKLLDLSRMRSAFKNKDDELCDILPQILEHLRDNAESLLQVKNFIGNYVHVSEFLDIVEYLKNLEVFAMRPALAFPPINVTDSDIQLYNQINKKLHIQNLVSQPGLRYAQADIMRTLIEDDDLFKMLSEDKRKKILTTFQNSIYGIMQEDIVLYETMQNCKKFGQMSLGDNDWLSYNTLPIKAYKASFPSTTPDQKYTEIDMVIEDKRKGHSFFLIEIKHTSESFEDHWKCLVDEDSTNRLTRGNGDISCRVALYNGESTIKGKIR